MKNINPMSTDSKWLDLLLGGYLYVTFMTWFFKKSYAFRLVFFFALFIISWIWVLCGAPGK